ncbi:MAG TPA: hypothetical protein VNZ49_17180 [Bacteroidia bacterium]|jgi:hypothetical protein|nr:hypothetical protein [Bacteroidia bacterium]
MKLKNLFTAAILTATLVSCGNDGTNDETLGETSDTANAKTIEKQKISAQNVFNSIPGPTELGKLVDEAGLDYDAALLNNPDDVNKYLSDNFKALNLGVYGADMAYANIHQQSQESMLFLKCVNSLCKSLGIAGVFDEKTVDRLEANKDNKDSLLTIINKSFLQADQFLRDNQRPHTSSLMVAGGWIEGLYLSAKVGTQSKSKKFIKKMSEQNQSLTDLITLVETAHVTGGGTFILEGLKDLKTSYAKIPSNMTMKDSMLTEIDQKVSALRKKIILQ